MCSLPGYLLNDLEIVVTETQVVIQGKEAMCLTEFIHFLQMRDYEVIFSMTRH
jgi:hypothetical protein